MEIYFSKLDILFDLLIHRSYKTDCIGEKFEDWCENGDIFFNKDFFKEEDSKECERIMKEIAPYVNKLTDKLYVLYEEGE